VRHFYVSVRANSPLAIRSDHAEGGAKTIQYITGTTVLGSLASAHRLLRAEQKDEFAQLFLNERMYFSHLYPASFNKSKSSGIDTSNLPVLPLPKTAQTCKRFPGFLPVPGEDTDEERHGIRDSLLDWAVFSLLDKEQSSTSKLLVPLSGHAFCTQCKRPMDSINGYYRRARSDPRQRMKAQVNTLLRTHTGINRDWGIVEEGILYNREVFEQGMPFWGEVILPDDLATTFKEFVEEADAEDIIRMGTGRTRGMGRVNIQVARETMEVVGGRARNIESFKNRLISFDKAMRKRAQEAKVTNLAPFYFAITLRSASILCDPFLRYRRTIDGAVLGELLNSSTITFSRVYQSTGVQRITGWNEVWGTPRTNDYAIEVGSTFLFACSFKPDDTLISDDTLTQALYRVEEEGIGRRRSEGFGRIYISDPFHLEGEQS